MNLKFVVLLSFLFAIACQQKKYPFTKLAGYAQGTTYHITYESRTGKDYSLQIDSLLKDFDLSLSIYKSKSVISRINDNDLTVEIDNHFRIVFNKSREIYDNSRGAFDITVGPLVNAWGFGPKAKEKIDKAVIDSLLQLTGMNKVRLSGNKVIKDKPGIKLDVNAIAQGYSVDLVCDFFKKEGLKNYMVEIGGELRAVGKNAKGELWKIGIDKPVEGDEPGQEIKAILRLDNKAVATSGNYRKFHVEKGMKYGHHIDPHTGYPTKNNLLSVSIISDNCITSDGNATACLVMGLQKTREYLKKHKELNAYLIYSDDKGNFKTEYTDYVKKYLVEEEK